MDKTISRSIKPLATLKKRSQFLALRKSPRFSCEDFVLQGNLVKLDQTHGVEVQKPSVGYTVTKKIGNSVERNRIRRRLRQALAEAMKMRLESQKDETPHGGFQGEMVVVARPSAIDQDYKDLVSNFTKGIDRIAAKGNKAG